MQLIVGRPPRSVCNSHRSLRSYILHWWTAAPPPPPMPFWTGATFNPIANSIKTFPARTPFTSCKQCWNRSLLSIFSAWMFKSDQQISRKVQIDKNKWNMFFLNWNKLYRVWLSRGHMMQHLEVYLIFCACIYHPPILYFISFDIEKYVGHLIKYCPK